MLNILALDFTILENQIIFIMPLQHRFTSVCVRARVCVGVRVCVRARACACVCVL
jgi:hypothetical protein